MRLTLKEHMTANCIIVGMMAGALAALYFGYPILIWQPLWVLIAFVVWFFSTGGIVFCNTEKPAKYSIDHTGTMNSAKWSLMNTS